MAVTVVVEVKVPEIVPQLDFGWARNAIKISFAEKKGMPSSLNATTKREAGSKNCKTTSSVDCFHGLPAVEHDLRRNDDTRAGVSTVYYIRAYCAWISIFHRSNYLVPARQPPHPAWPLAYVRALKQDGLFKTEEVSQLLGFGELGKWWLNLQNWWFWDPSSWCLILVLRNAMSIVQGCSRYRELTTSKPLGLGRILNNSHVTSGDVKVTGPLASSDGGGSGCQTWPQLRIAALKFGQGTTKCKAYDVLLKGLVKSCHVSGLIWKNKQNWYG